MSIPIKLQNSIQNLEMQANNLLNENRYKIARSYYINILNILMISQKDFNKRIHLGAPLHMIGITYLFEEDTAKAFPYFLKAYIADIINQEYGHERSAEGSPAYNILKNLYAFSNDNFFKLYELSEEYTDRTSPFYPDRFLIHFLEKMGIVRKNINLLYNIPSSLKVIISGSSKEIPISENGKRVINDAVAKYGNTIMNIAYNIAKKNNRNHITENDLELALRQIKNKGDKSIGE